MHTLHSAQKKILELLKANYDEPLTVRGLQEKIEASSPSVVHHHITQLEKKGYLRRNPANPYDYQVLGGNPEKSIAYLNAYGMAQCGPNGSLLDGNPTERIPISSKLLGFPASEGFIVKARGNSMTPKINPNDLVIVKKANDANNGDIVVCVNKGQTLIKKIQKIKNNQQSITYNLISLNDNYSPFAADEDFRIEGIVKSVISYAV